MKFNAEIIILVLIFSLLSNICLAADSLQGATVHSFLSRFCARKPDAHGPIHCCYGGDPRAPVPEISKRSVPLFARHSRYGTTLYRCETRLSLRRCQRSVCSRPILFSETMPQTLEKTIAMSSDKTLLFIGPGSFEDWDPIEDFEHATQYETWNHVYDSEETRTRTGKWYWADLDPNLKNEPDLDIGFDSRHSAGSLRLTAKRQRHLSTRSHNFRRGDFKPCY